MPEKRKPKSDSIVVRTETLGRKSPINVYGERIEFNIHDLADATLYTFPWQGERHGVMRKGERVEFYIVE